MTGRVQTWLHGAEGLWEHVLFVVSEAVFGTMRCGLRWQGACCVCDKAAGWWGYGRVVAACACVSLSCVSRALRHAPSRGCLILGTAGSRWLLGVGWRRLLGNRCVVPRVH